MTNATRYSILAVLVLAVAVTVALRRDERGSSPGRTPVTVVALHRLVDVGGQIRVKRVTVAQDLGQVVNPEGTRAQMEGCIIMGLSSVLTEEIHFDGGAIKERNFGSYDITRFSWVPNIETILIDNPELTPQGCGEPTITCVAPVIANALFDATGFRLFRLPLTPQRVKEAVAAKTLTNVV
jgi:nicotinate dehydrogenase subunit B